MKLGNCITCPMSLISEEQVFFGNLSRLHRSVLFKKYRQTHNAMDFGLQVRIITCHMIEIKGSVWSSSVLYLISLLITFYACDISNLAFSLN